MSSDDATDDRSGRTAEADGDTSDEPEPVPVERGSGAGAATEDPSADGTEVRDRIEAEAERAREGFDERLVDLLAWLLETETRARIYVHLRQEPGSTSEEIAEGTGLYPSTVREAIAELHEEGTVTREKRDADGAGNNPFEYRAIPPSDLVSDALEQVQGELNTIFNLDRHLGIGGDEPATEPVTITVTAAEDDADDSSSAGSPAGKSASDEGSADHDTAGAE